MSIDWDKQVETRDGCEVRIYTNEGRLMHYPVVGEYRKEDGFQIGKWTSEGHWSCSSIHSDDRDLINVPQKHTMWVNVYEKFGSWVHESKANADAKANEHRMACIEVTFTEGEGLE